MAASQIDLFMASIRALESGGGNPRGNYNARNAGSGAHGAYQIMPSNWAPWAREAGIPGANPRDPKAQDIVARHKMLQYYRQFGSWDAVAVAWFAGPGRAKRFQGGQNLSAINDGNMSVPAYVNRIRSHMQDFAGQYEREGQELAYSPEQIQQFMTSGAGRRFDEVALGEDVGEREEINPADLFETMISTLSERLRNPALDEGDSLTDVDDATSTLIEQESPLTTTPNPLLDDVAEGEGIDPFGNVGIQQFEAITGFGLGKSLPQDGSDPLAGIVDVTGDTTGDTLSATPQATGKANEIVEIAKQYLGTPYKWGGTSPTSGFDCSGLIQYVYNKAGVSLPRVSADQARAGRSVEGGLGNARVGDLVFWRGGGGRPNHIGIYVGNGKMLEAPRTGLNVRIRDIGREPDSIRRVL